MIRLVTSASSQKIGGVICLWISHDSLEALRKDDLPRLEQKL
jgi:hypothetical protein